MTTNPISGSSNPSDKLPSIITACPDDIERCNFVIDGICITERELFKSKQKKQRKRTKAISNAEKIKSYQDLNEAHAQ
jgi:transcription-repair coupling factor (superfamily II helicase)